MSSPPAPISMRRTWPQRLTIVVVVVTALASFAAAGGLALGQWVLSDRQLVSIVGPSSDFSGGSAAPEVVLPGATAPPPEDAASVTTTTVLELAEPDAANFLIVGADNNDCGVDGAPVEDDRGGLGERSDTIMIWRANPAANQLAVLSLPRDLYVDIAGGRKARINSAYVRDDPTKLIDTIFLNFGIPIDHYVQVDFCAFQRLVDAVGGVQVPFSAPARDRRSGLLVTETGCVNLDGAQALAYVRSRHYQYEDPPGSDEWSEDGTSDFGRIARQQDFLRRVVAKVINEGLYSPGVATAIIDTNQQYLVTDTGLTLRRMLEFANTLRRLDPTQIATYRIESSSETTSAGEEVERPRLGGDNMLAILSVFRGEATIASAPEQVFESTTTLPVDADDDEGGEDDALAEDDAEPDEPDDTSTTLPSVEVESNTVGIVPDPTITCD
ncbi:MAG TPA: LCP family protein [Ilumatobacter sp.]|nr:LCP family protein [Ilumatobacter sp.]